MLDITENKLYKCHQCSFAVYGICRTPHQTDECSTRRFLRKTWAQGRNLDTLGTPKYASSPVGIPLKRSASGGMRLT